MAIDHDCGPGLRQSARNGGADVLSRPGDDCDASFEILFVNVRH
jgi:hypothetical protein